MASSKKNAFRIAAICFIGAGAFVAYTDATPSAGSEDKLAAMFSPNASTSANAEPSSVNQKIVNPEIETTRPEAPVRTASPDLGEKELSFEVAPDYRSALAAQRMLENAINKEATATWVQMRMYANAERERVALADLELTRARKEFEREKYKQQKEAMAKGLMDIATPNGNSVVGQVNVGNEEFAGTAPSEKQSVIKVLSYTGKTGQSEAFVSLEINGQVHTGVTQGQSVANFAVTGLNDERGCVDLLKNTPSRHNPVTRACI